jgi:hypothetical protein
MSDKPIRLLENWILEFLDLNWGKHKDRATYLTTAHADQVYLDRRDACGPLLLEMGESKVWSRLMNLKNGETRRPESKQLSFLDQFTDLPRSHALLPSHGYLPAGPDDDEDRGQGTHLEIEAMTSKEVLESAQYDDRQARGYQIKAEAKRDHVLWRRAHEIPDDVSLIDWMANNPCITPA